MSNITFSVIEIYNYPTINGDIKTSLFLEDANNKEVFLTHYYISDYTDITTIDISALQPYDKISIDVNDNAFTIVGIDKRTNHIPQCTLCFNEYNVTINNKLTVSRINNDNHHICPCAMTTRVTNFFNHLILKNYPISHSELLPHVNNNKIENSIVLLSSVSDLKQIFDTTQFEQINNYKGLLRCLKFSMNTEVNPMFITMVQDMIRVITKAYMYPNTVCKTINVTNPNMLYCNDVAPYILQLNTLDSTEIRLVEKLPHFIKNELNGLIQFISSL